VDFGWFCIETTKLEKQQKTKSEKGVPNFFGLCTFFGENGTPVKMIRYTE